MYKLGWGHHTKFKYISKTEGGTPHIPIWNNWSDVLTRVGILHKIQIYFQNRRGTPHIPIEVIRSDVQTRVGTQHKILRCFRSRGGVHRTFHLSVSVILVNKTPNKFQLPSQSKIHMVGWPAGRPGGSDRKYNHFVAPSCKLELARFPA